MSRAPLSHPDRLAATLANLDAAWAQRPPAGCAAPCAGAADARIELKLALWRARRAAARSAAAAAHLAAYAADEHPDLWAGTVQDGVARGFLVRLEEVAALAPPEPQAPTIDGQTFAGKELRRKRDLLVASGGTRVRFSRKGGLLIVDRDRELHSTNALWFEARRDLGTLDGFVGADDERPRLFSAQFLQPHRYVQGADGAELELVGRLGRGPIGWPCRVLATGHRAERHVRLTIELPTVAPGWRLRARFLGVPAACVHHDCEPVREVVANDHGGFVADTLVRACGTLLVDGRTVAVPDAAAPRNLRHGFALGERTP
ncbi:MAG TPA: hypothetical protein ENI87_09120 [bacterium]|nr:hypothetical protein [bacterium]